MLEQPVSPRDELALVGGASDIAPSKLHITRLEQENRRLHAELVVAREQEKAAQERATHLARANAALQKTIDALGRIQSVEEFIPAVLKIVAESFQATQCAFYEHAEADLIYLRYCFIDGRVLKPSEILALDPDKYSFIIQLAGGFTAPDAYLGTSARQRTRAVQLDHASGTCVAEFDEFCRGCGWESELNVPCVVGRTAEGALVIYRGPGLPYSESEIALAETLAVQLALALQISRLAQEAKQAALAKLNEVIAREQEQAAQERAAELEKLNIALVHETEERRQAESIVRSQNRALTRSLELLLQQSNARGLLEALLNNLITELSIYTANIWLLNDNTTTLSRIPVASAKTSLPQFAPPYEQIFATLLSNQQGWRQTVRYTPNDLALPESLRTFDQTHRVREVFSTPLLLGNKTLGWLVCVLRQDSPPFTADKTAFLEAIASQATLALRLDHFAEEAKQAAILAERNRMARDIHDTLAQSFRGIIMQLEAFKSTSMFDPGEVDIRLNRISELARLGLSEARRSVQSLRPTALETADFPDALHHLLYQITNGTPIHTVLHVEGSPQPLPATVEENLLRIAQEALTNAIRHGHAQTINLQLLFEPTAVHLQIITDEDIFRGLSAGAKGYLLKDTTAEELIGAVRTVYRGRKYIPPNVAVKLAERLSSNELTGRELEVLRLISKGKSNSDIGGLLSISEGTVKFHLNNIFTKLGVRDRTQAVITALQRGLVRLN